MRRRAVRVRCLPYCAKPFDCYACSSFEGGTRSFPKRERETRKMKYTVAISGSYGGMNLGDEAILEVILIELPASLEVDVTVSPHNAKDTERRHKVRAVPIRELHKDEVLGELR